MSDLTVERRLALVQSIREENDRNRNNIRNRQQLLYGQEYSRPAPFSAEEAPAASSFGIRFLAALAIFVLFVVWDQSDMCFLQQTPADLSSHLKTNYDLKNIDFAEKITYTLNNVQIQEKNGHEDAQ